MMKKLLLLTLIVGLGTELSAAEKKAQKAPEKKKPAREVAQVHSQSPEAAVLAKFLSCRAVLQAATDASWESCMEPTTVSASFRRKAFAAFLMSPIEIHQIRDCEKADLWKQRTFPGKTERSVCFDYTDGGEKRTGVAFFTKTDGELRLFSLASSL